MDFALNAIANIHGIQTCPLHVRLAPIFDPAIHAFAPPFKDHHRLRNSSR
jgi:hypothetical protein